MDYVNNVAKTCTLVNYYPNESFLEKIKPSSKGTAVLWWDIDRLTKETQTAHPESMDKFMRTTDSIKKHLSMVFHRYLTEGLQIFFRDKLN